MIKKSKRLIFLLILLVLSIGLYFFKSYIPDIYFNAGKNYYLNQDYVNAYSNLKHAYAFNPTHYDYRYYYISTLKKLNPTYEIQREAFNVANADCADSADIIADQLVDSWRNKILSSAGENYIEQTVMNGNIVRWDRNTFPLVVKIVSAEGVEVPDYYIKEIRKAFIQWQLSTSSYISFKFDNADTPDIMVEVQSLPADVCKDGTAECKYSVAYTQPEIKGNLLQKMMIVFYDKNNVGGYFSAKDIYNTALHEIGHALGIMGHSYNKDDLMYMASSVDKDYVDYRSDFQYLSPVDLNTVILLYKIMPDISNTPVGSFNQTGMIYGPILFGNETKINSVKYLEATRYIEAAPNLPNGYIDLALAYAGLKQYSKALDALHDAYLRTTKNEERYVIYYNTAVIYVEIQDWNKALEYANRVRKINPQSDIDGFIAMIYYKRGETKMAKELYIDAVKKHPENIIDSVNLATLYLHEFNFAAAGHVLNNLIAHNPDAVNHPKVKSYSLLTFLFK